MNYEKALAQRIPDKSLPLVTHWLVRDRVDLKITPPRTTKYADYRPPEKNISHRITINNDLNPFAFLITLVHEIAHLMVWKKYRNRVLPHGKQWKDEFRILMEPLLQLDIFPIELLEALTQYLLKPSASSCTDLQLTRIVNKYSVEKKTYLESIPERCRFTLQGGRMFIKGKKLRKRYQCKEVKSGKQYLINPLAEVTLVDELNFYAE